MKRLMFAAAACVAACATANVRLAPVFGDRMVLQREAPVRIWGCADPRETVTVEFAGQTVVTKATDYGTWQATLAPLAASKEGRVLTVRGAKPDGAHLFNGFGLFAAKNATNVQTIEDVLVGEVWFCAGQSNTDCPIWGVADGSPRYRDGQGALALQMTCRPCVRLVKTPLVWSVTPKYDVSAEWMEMTPALYDACLKGTRMPSAMGYYYARELYDALDVPIGLIDSSWGGTNIDAWTPRSAYETHPELKDVAALPVLDAVDFTAAREKGGVYHGKGIYGGAQQQPTALWNGMVAAYAPMTLRGFIWYQGCHNSGKDEWPRYCDKMHALYDGWAKEFQNPDLKLYFVQLAPWGYDGIAHIQEMQAKFDAEEPHAGMAVINDTGNLHDIHPNDKRTVARRLAAHALRRDYGFTAIRDNSPTLKGWRTDGDAFVLSFNDAEGFYVYNPDRSVQTGFEIAGADGVFKPAQIVNLVTSDYKGKPVYRGRVDGKTLVVRAEGVAAPMKLRYLHARPWFGSVYNESSLPLGAFHIGD